MPTMRDRISAAIPGCKIAWDWTCCSPSQEPTFRSLLERLRPRVVVEIGTHQGVSAALLAEYAERVITIDVLPNPARHAVWDALGVRDKIEEHVHKSSAGRDAEIARAANVADLSFVDGSHLMPDVERDFCLVLPTKRILLHDYWENAEDWPDVKEFVDHQIVNGFDVTIRKPFALVEVPK